MIRTLQDILKIFIMTFTLPMFTTRCYPCCLLISLCLSPAVLRQSLLSWLWGVETQRSHCGEQHGATSKSHLETEQLKTSSHQSNLCLMGESKNIPSQSVRGDSPLQPPLCLCSVCPHKAQSSVAAEDHWSWPGWACPCPHEWNKQPLKDEGRSLSVMAWWFSANSCPGSSLRQINTCNKAHHAPITAAICIGRLMLDEGEMCVPEGKGT